MSRQSADDRTADELSTNKTRREYLWGSGAVAAAPLVGQYLSGSSSGSESSLTAPHMTVADEDNRLGPVTPRDTIYQILVDRFYDADSSNNDYEDFNSDLYDGTGEDLKRYQGGDWQGVIEQIPYLVDMGITAVWISAPYANRETKIEDYNDDGTVDVWTSYHGYHVRNYFAPNRFFGDMGDFESMRDALHENGIKLVIDFVSNHTSRWQNPTNDYEPEHGRLYEPDTDENGNYVFDDEGNAVGDNLLADPHGENADWFHNIGPREGDTSRFDYRYKDLASLADFNHEHSDTVEHLTRAARFWKAKGVDGFRHDATLHMNPAFAKNLKQEIDSAPGGPVTHFGEFFISRPDPKYEEFRTFPDRTGIHNLDFEYMRAQTSAFGDFSETMEDFAEMLIDTHDDYTHEHHAINFVDNHDVGRFRLSQYNDAVYHAALAAVMTVRGTPKIYYGTEQYVEPESDSPNAGRVYMENVGFDRSTTAYQLISELAALRDENFGLAYGQTHIRHASDDVIVYERTFYDHSVVVAINRHPHESRNVPSLDVNLPNGTYGDYLGGLLGGRSVSVSSGTVDSFTLEGGEVSVWEATPDMDQSVPRLGTVVSTMGTTGDTAYLYGTGLGGDVAVRFDNEPATVVENAETSIEVTVPDATPGEVDVTVEKNGATSNPVAYELLSGTQLQTIFHVNAETEPGEQIHVVGGLPELGNWEPEEATEAFHAPEYPDWFLPVSVPTDTTFEFKFVKIADDGSVTWESGDNRTFTAPDDPNGVVDTPSYDFRG